MFVNLILIDNFWEIHTASEEAFGFLWDSMTFLISPF